MSKIIATEQLGLVDVDGTLLLWDRPVTAKNEHELVEFYDPYECQTKYVLAHWPHIKIVKDRLKRGAAIIVWSQSGHEWAAQAVKACGLLGYENLCITSKPVFYIDDLPVTDWMKERIFLSPDSQYGLTARAKADIIKAK